MGWLQDCFPPRQTWAMAAFTSSGVTALLAEAGVSWGGDMHPLFASARVMVAAAGLAHVQAAEAECTCYL